MNSILSSKHSRRPDSFNSNRESTINPRVDDRFSRSNDPVKSAALPPAAIPLEQKYGMRGGDYRAAETSHGSLFNEGKQWGA